MYKNPHETNVALRHFVVLKDLVIYCLSLAFESSTIAAETHGWRTWRVHT